MTCRGNPALYGKISFYVCTHPITDASSSLLKLGIKHFTLDEKGVIYSDCSINTHDKFLKD